MNIKPATMAFTVLIAAAAFAPLHAQNRGLRIVQAQPQTTPASTLSVNPVQGMTTPPIQAVTNSPILPLGGGIVPPQQLQHGGNATYSTNVVVLAPGEVAITSLLHQHMDVPTRLSELQGRTANEVGDLRVDLLKRQLRD